MSDPKTSGKDSKYLIRLLLTVNTLVAIFYYSFLAFLRDYASSSVSTLDIVFVLGHGTMVFIGTFLLIFSISYVLIATLYFLYSLIRRAPWSKRPTTVRRLPRAAVLRPKVTLGTSILIMIMAIMGFIPFFTVSNAPSDISKLHNEYQEAISNADDPASAYNKYVEEMIKTIEHLSETTTGIEQQVYQIVAEMVHEQESFYAAWNETFEAVQSPRMLDYSLLTTDEEFDFQRNVLLNHIRQSKIYDTKFRDKLLNAYQQLKSLSNEDNKFVKASMEGMLKGHHNMQPRVTLLMQTHVEYSNQLIQLLDFLQENKNKWYHDGDSILFDNEVLLDQFNKFIEIGTQIELTLNTLSEELMRAM